MTVSSETTYTGPLIANGVATAFPWTFLAMSADEISVFGLDAAGATVSLPAFTAALAGTAPSAGTVTFNTAPADGTRVWIASDPEFLQEIGFEDGSRWLAGPVNEANDRAALRTLAVKRDADRAVKLPIGDPGVTLPAGSGPTLYTSVNTLAGISEDIEIVAARDADIVTVAARDADIGTVAARDADIGTVAARDTDVGTVAARDADIGTVAARDAAIGVVAARDADIGTVAARDTDIGTVADRDADIGAVAAIDAKVAIAADNVADITTAADNIAAISAAPTAAANAQTAATTATDQATIAASYADVLSGVESIPGGVKWGVADEDGEVFFAVTPDSVDHATLSKANEMPDWSNKAGAPKLAITDDDGNVFASFSPNLGGIEHADATDWRRRLYALEIASQADAATWGDLYPVTDILGLAAHGQSRSRGHSSTGVTTTSAFSTTFPPTLGQMFNGGVRPDDLSTNMATQAASFTALAESYIASAANPTNSNGTTDGETFMSGCIDMIGQLLRDENNADLSTFGQKFLGFSVGRGATAVNDLLPTNDTYGRHALLEDLIDRSGSVGAAASKSVEMGALLVSQGEGDLTTNTTTWANGWRAIHTAAEAKAHAELGGSRPLLAIIEQIANHPLAGNTPALAIAQAAMAFSDTYFTCFPSHMIPRLSSSDIHDTGVGSYWKGGFYGWILKRWLYDAVKVLPLTPTWSRSGSQIIAAFDVGPNRKMTTDTVWIASQTNWGVTLENGAGVAQTISNGRWVNHRTLVFDCASAPQAGWTAYTGKAGSSSLGLCNLCDDTPIVMEKIQRPIRRYVPIWSQVLA